MIEVSAYSVQWAIDAQTAGAKRVELCDNIYEGGTTPSYASIKLARKYLDIDLYVIIRPRAGDFVYSDIEFETMKENIFVAKSLGVNGLVFGLLNNDGSVDTERTRELVKLSYPLPVTFHRAFDLTKNPLLALEDIINCGCKRILTSGQKATAIEGVELLEQLVAQSKNRISIMPGSGINEKNILELKNRTKALEFHLSGKKTVKSTMQYINKDVNFNAKNNNPVQEFATVDIEKIKKVCTLMSS